MVDNNTQVLIGIVTGEYARRADFYDYYNLLDKPGHCYYLPCHDRSPAKGRNMIVEAAFQHDCTHILFIDDDMAYPPDSLMKLLEHDKDVVSGLYLTRAYPHQALIFDVADDSGACLHTYLTKDVDGLIPIVAAGLGFCLIKTEVFRKMEKPWIRLGELDPEQWCDDMGFFKRVREAGFQPYCDTNVRIGHMGTMIIWPDRKEDGQWLTGYDTNGTGMIRTPQFYPEMKYQFAEQGRSDKK